MMKTIAIANTKGGTGKTTTAISLATALATMHGKRVLAVDACPGCCMTDTLLKGAGAARSLYELTTQKVNRRLDGSLIHGVRENLDLVAGTEWLCLADVLLDGRKNAREFLQVALRGVRYDYAVIDCPPSPGILTEAALWAADIVLVPTLPEYYSAGGLLTVEKTLSEMDKRIDGVILTRWNGTKGKYREIRDTLTDIYDNAMYATVIRENVRLSECCDAAEDIFTYDPMCNGAADYAALTDEFLKRHS